MKTVNLLRYLKGYVRFNALGGFTERFINLCAGNSIYIFNSSYEKGVFFGETDIRNFKKLRAVARKTGVRIIVRKKLGLPFFIRQKKHRAGILAGAVFYCVFIVVMNMFVWSIDASGSEKYSSEQIIEAAEKAGVKYGISRFFFDENKAARDIYRIFGGELSWVTVNIRASKCFIEVRDSDETVKEEEENKEPSNLIADFDGVIMSDETYSGIKSISKGSAVKKGDLLISGVMEDDYGSAVYYNAKGKFTARHNRYFESTLPTDMKFFRICPHPKKYIFHFFTLPVRIGSINKSKATDSYQNERFLQYGEHILPVGVSVITPTHSEEALLPREALHILAADMFTALSYQELSNTHILSEKIEVFAEESKMGIKGEYDCVDFIGISKPIIVENNESG